MTTTDTAVAVTVRALGEAVAEAAITDTVDFDEPLLDVATDKVDTEIPSPAAGILEPEDTVVAVGATIARLGVAQPEPVFPPQPQAEPAGSAARSGDSFGHAA